MSPVFGHGRLRLYLLKLLAEQPRHGYEMIRLLEDHFEGMYAPSAGTVYPRLTRLEREGLVTHSREGGRKVYDITDAGRAELARRHDELEALEEELDDSAASLADLAREIHDGVRDTVEGLKHDFKLAKAELKQELKHGLQHELKQAAWEVAAQQWEQRWERDAGEHEDHLEGGSRRGARGRDRSRGRHAAGAAGPAADERGRGRAARDGDAGRARGDERDPGEALGHGPPGGHERRFDRLLGEFGKQARRVASASSPTEAQLGECVAILDEALDRLRVALTRDD
jgi:DNA-binding PadR family transcriptional regulator